MADAEPPDVTLFVMDTGPLITLAAADSLDYLKLPGAPVCIPDAVFYEATRKAGALGAQSITDWVQENRGAVEIIPTHIFSASQALDGNPSVPRDQRDKLLKDMGERSAMEVAKASLPDPEANAIAVIVTEDFRALKQSRQALDPQILTITTSDFLHGLEAAGRINSAEEVYRRAEDAGRLVKYQRQLADEREAQERSMAALRQVMAAQERRRRDPGRER